MTTKRRKTIAVTAVVCVIWIALGSFGFLPSFFFNTYLGQSHSLFAPMAALLDLALYVFFAYVLATIIVGVIGSTSRRNG